MLTHDETTDKTESDIPTMYLSWKYSQDLIVFFLLILLFFWSFTWLFLIPLIPFQEMNNKFKRRIRFLQNVN